MKKSQINLVIVFLLFIASSMTIQAQNRNNNIYKNNNNNNAGSWKILGTLHAQHTTDHDRLEVNGPHDYFR
jgi:hypothetical protein